VSAFVGSFRLFANGLVYWVSEVYLVLLRLFAILHVCQRFLATTSFIGDFLLYFNYNGRKKHCAEWTIAEWGW